MKLLLLFLLASVACWAQTPTLVAHGSAANSYESIGVAVYDGFSSSLTISGSAGETCTLSSFNGGGTGAAATVTLTGTNTIANLTPLVFTNAGSGYATTPTSATGGSGTATCSGTVGLAQVNMGAAQTTSLNSAACTQHCAFVLFVAMAPSSPISETPYDSVGNLYVQVPPLPQTTPIVINYPIHEDGDVGYQTWVCMGCTTSATHTFTAPGYGAALSVMVFQNGASAPDQQCNSGTSGNAQSGTCFPAKNDEIIVSGVGVCGSGSYAILSGGLTALDTVNWNGGYNGNVGLADAYIIQTTRTAVFADWNTGDGCSAAQLVTIYSAAAPATLAATNTAIVEGFENVPYSFTFTATGGVAPYTCGAISSLPTGITQGTGQKTCTISGTPTVTANATSISVTFTDDVGSMATTSGLAITIASTILSISTTSLPAGTQYGTYSSSVAATGGTVGAGYTWSIGPYPSASLPEGIALNTSTGALTSSAIGGQGTYGVQFCVTDSLNYVACKFLNIGLAGSTSWMSNLFSDTPNIFHTKIDLADCSTCVADTSPAAPIPSAYLASKIQPLFGSGPGGQGHTPNGIPAIEVPYNQADVNVTVNYYQIFFGVPGGSNPNTCTSGGCPMTAPIPANQPVEDSIACGNGCDSHSITYVESGGGNKAMLYEQDQAIPNAEPATSWQDTSNALWPDMTSNAMPPQGYGTTDAAGLPIAPFLLYYEEVNSCSVSQPARFTLEHVLPFYVWPATTNYASCCGSCPGYTRGTQLSQSSPPASCTSSAPYGEIYRLPAATYASIQGGSIMACYAAGTCPQSKCIVDGFYQHGIILADAGISGGLIGTPDTRWNDTDLVNLESLTLANFEAVNLSSLNTGGNTSYATGASTIPTITTACPMPAAIIGQPYSQTLIATNPPITWSIASGSLPTGLSLSGAILSGTPTTAQVASFSIGASNGSGAGTNSPLSCSITVTTFATPFGVGMVGSQTSLGNVRIAQ